MNDGCGTVGCAGCGLGPEPHGPDCPARKSTTATDTHGGFKVSIDGRLVGVIRRFEPREQRTIDNLVAQMRVVDMVPTAPVDFELRAERIVGTPDLCDQFPPEPLRELFVRLGVPPPKELEPILDQPYWFAGVKHGPLVDENGEVVATAQPMTYVVTGKTDDEPDT